MKRSLAAALFVALAVATCPAAALPADAAARSPAPAPGAEDLRARNLFQEHRYADALVIYTQLYARTHHPTYLRNVGRCHQMLREPEPAISYFRAYLRDAHDVGAGERAEIEGYISEMEALQQAPSPASPAVPPAATPATVPAQAPAVAPALATEPDAPKAPLTRRWWFWTGIGALLVGGVIASVVAANHTSSRLPCPMDTVCPP
jgi:hypothetical protein